MRRPLIFMILAINSAIVLAQNDTIPHMFTGFQADYGFIIPHSAAIRPVSNTKPYGFELTRGRLNTTFERWKIFNSYWISGFQARYINFRYPEVLGSQFDVTLFAEPVIAHGRNLFLTARGGTGIAYLTEIYDEETNPANQFFCTRISFSEYLNILLRYRVSEHICLKLSGCFNHTSNGGIKQPNYGMNYPAVSLGLEYFDNPFPLLTNNYRNDLSVPKPGISFTLQFLSGIRVIDKTDLYPEKMTYAWGFHARISKQLKKWYSLNAGAEIISDRYIRELVRRAGTGLDHKRIALTAGQEFLFGRVSFTQYFGFYVYSPYKAMSFFYEKYELSYRIHKNISFGIFLKAHGKDSELAGASLNCLLLRN